MHKMIVQRIFQKEILFFLIPLVCGTVVLLSFYPGLMSFDSIYQWSEAMDLSITNWHPAYHTILIWILTRVWESPAVVALFQVILFSLALYYVFSTFRLLGIPYLLLLFANISVSLALLNTILIITLWKDIPYSIFVLVLTVIILKAVMSEGEYLSQRYVWVCLGIVLANIILLRHNGFPIVIGTVIGLIAGFPSRRSILMRSSFVTLCYVIIFIGPIYSALNVDKSPTKSQTLGVALIHPIAAYVNQNITISNTDFNYLNEVLPLENGWPYSCYDATVLFYEGANFRPVQEEPQKALSILLRYTIQKPSILFKHFYCLSSFTWQLKQPEDVYLETIILDNNAIHLYLPWEKYEGTIIRESLFPNLNQLIIKTINHINIIDKDKILWRPGIYLFSIMILLLFFAILEKKWRILLITLPIGLHTLIIMFTAQLQAVRYQYPVYLITMCFFAPFAYLSYKSIKKETCRLGE